MTAFSLTLLLTGCGTTEIPQGPPGPAGPAGPAGLIFTGPYTPQTSYTPTEIVTFQGSAYVALKTSLNVPPEDESASAEDWAMLARDGETGPAGPQGTQGLQGSVGPQGGPGLTGVAGPTGPQGPQGAVGAKGATGAAGPVGSPGVSGPQGAAGATGATGAAGPAGLSGPAGPAGPQGTQGTQGATGAAGASGPQGVPGTSQVSFLQGRRFSVQGDSISAELGNGWQNVVIARTGMTLQTQDARGGRSFATSLECWGNPSLGNPPGNFDASFPVYRGTCGTLDTGIADGTPFAESLQNVDLLIIDLGSNDQGFTIGSLGDPTNAGTYFGNMRWVVEAYLTAKPALRLVMITNQYLGYSTVKSGVVAAATVTYANSMGVPVLNMFQKGGVNSITLDALTPDGVHPNPFDLNNIYGPTIAQFLQSIF